jgi:hypothetical protein
MYLGNGSWAPWLLHSGPSRVSAVEPQYPTTSSQVASPIVRINKRRRAPVKQPIERDLSRFSSIGSPAG